MSKNTASSYPDLSLPAAVPKSQPALTGEPLLVPDLPAATLPALFISHGAPTLAIEQSATTNALARLGQNLPKPRAIVIMSAHWLSSKLELSSHPAPVTWHDFSGFDAELYRIRYPVAGHPALAESLAQQLSTRGIACSVNPLRALDHGVWSPLLHLYPDADVPVIQLSLPQHYDSHACYQLGALFAALRQEQVLLIGSGNITHNLAAMRWNAASIDDTAQAFKVWLLAQLKTHIPTALDWQQFAAAGEVHPSTEHLLPLFFALGAGQRVSVVHESMAHHSLGMDIYRFD
jgi:4,5-DOPA dioxygenase extradiol